VASALSATEYSFGSGNPESEGTWSYRVTESNESAPSEPSPASEEIKVDQTPPTPPTATPDRAPDYAGGGGWYKDTVTVSFSEGTDPLLSDGSPGSGVNPASIPGPVTFNTDGSHEASGTEADNVGNVSSPGSLTVQVDASPPEVQVSCPATAPVGSSVSATVTASDGQSGLGSDPSGSVPIDTTKTGPQTITRTAIDNVGHEASASCTTEVIETTVISGRHKGKLIVKGGEAVQLTATAQTNQIEVKEGGSLDVEGAKTKGITANGASVIRICGASVGAVKLKGDTGPITLGEESGCGPSSFSAASQVQNNTDGVGVVGNTFKGSLKVTGNSGGTTVVNNAIGQNLNVTGNAAPVVDAPNTVGGKAKTQARRAKKS
jgi:hypothetical protein